MLEAVNSVVSNASLLRGQAEQVSAARSLAANPESVQVVPQAPFISPYIHMDVNFDKAVLALRDRDTGDFLTTIPSDSKLQAQAQDEARRAQVEQQARSQISAPAPESVQAQPQPQVQAQTAPTPAASTASFGAFAKQVASLQTAIAGTSTGSTVSVTA